MKSSKIFIYVLGLLTIFSSCSKHTTKSPISESTTSYIQLIHACPGLPGIKLWEDEIPLQEVGRYYKSNTHYISIKSGKRKLEIKRSSTNLSLAAFNEVVLPNYKYSLFASCDSLYNFIPLLIKDVPLPINSEFAQLRIVNLLSKAECIDAVINNEILISKIGHRTATEYSYIRSGLCNLIIKNNKGNSIIINNVTLSFDKERIYTLYINGFTNQEGAFGPDAILMANL